MIRTVFQRITASVATLAIAVLFLIATEARAVSVTVGATTYNIETITGTYNSLNATLTSLPWFEESSLAESLAIALGTNLGTPNSVNTGDQGPLFVFGEDDMSVAYQAYFTDVPLPGVGNSSIGKNTVAVWASISPVPIPAAMPLFVTALAGLGMIGRRRRRSSS